MTVTIYDHRLRCTTHKIYDVTFFGDRIRTLVTNSPSMVESWITEIELIHHSKLHHLIVGLDMEHHPVATLQLCVGRRCLIFQIIHAPDIPQALEDFLLNENYTFVGVKVEENVKRLENYYNLSVGNAVDLRTLAADRARALGMDMKKLKQAGLKVLSERVLGKKFEKVKQIQLTSEDDCWLSCDQVQYACVDAFVSFEIGRTLKKSAGSLRSSSSSPIPSSCCSIFVMVSLVLLFVVFGIEW